MVFKNEEKCRIFDKIAEHYFARNFGSMSKSDFETLLFSEYIELRIEKGLPFDDYSLSKELGITQARIRTLKEKKELKYPYDKFKWQKAFAESVKNAKYDPNDHYVKMIVQDINVMNEVRNFIENKGWYDECSLNKKLLRIPLDCFVEIFYNDSSFENVFTDDAKEQIKKIAKSENNTIKEFLSDFTKDGLKAFLMSASKELISDVIKSLPFGGTAKIAFDFIANAIKEA